MNNIKRAIFTILFAISALQGYSQFKDTVDINLPTLDYTTSKKYNIKDIKVTGVKYISPELIISASGLNRGDSVYLPGDYIANALQMLWTQRYYSDIKAIVETEGDDAYLEIVLKERPRVSIWNFTGTTKGEQRELLERLNLRERTELSDYALKNSTDIIKKYYAEKAYLNAEVNITQQNDSILDNFVIVTFNVDKKNKVKIGKINIEGNKELSEKKLKSSMKNTREKSLRNIFKSKKFSESEFENSKQELVDYMQSMGFRDGMIVSDTVYPLNEKRLGIDIKIEEGKKYFYRNISWIGNTKYNSDYLSLVLGVQKGDVYDRKNMIYRLGLDGEAAVKEDLNVMSLYLNEGYLAFNVEPVETIIEGDSIDIEIRMVEGNQFTVNDIGISGNNRVNDRVVRRELYVRPGELYDQSMLITSIRLLGNMGHFNPEKIQPDLQPVGDNMVDLRFNLEEQPSDQFEVSGGWGGGMFVASLGITFNNVSVRKAFQKGAWRPYPSGDNQQVKINVQSNGSYYQAVSLSFLEPWLGGKKPTSFSVSMYYSSESDAIYFWERSSSRFRTIGVSVGLGKRLAWPDPYFTLSGELSYQAYNLKDWDYFLIRNGQSNTIAISGTLMRNSTDAQIYPRTGSEMYVKLTLTPPWSLFNGKDYSNPNMPSNERYKWIEYYKVNAMARWYLPMLSNNKLVLMTRAEFGYLGAYNPDKPSPFEGFSMGGDGVTGYNLYGIQDIALRGYESNALTPYASSGRQAKIYTKYVAELRYPVVMQPSSTVYFLAFAEAGNAFYNWKSFNPFDLKRSAGVGLRLFLPVVGLFGIDWGYGFDRVNGSDSPSGGKISFSFGQNF
ncbi:MAG TPA: outer membrane protein assembly factor BamA [Candidatus Avirikenella pullistercoris]|nr:outer membrane protein assembly factor BamA [Candidatus Avirikenella pullistercoris]